MKKKDSYQSETNTCILARIKKKNGIANEHVDVISTGIVCLPSSRVGASKYEPNGNFCDLCPNYADSASDGGVTYCDATAPVAIQSGCSAKTAEFITASWKTPQHSKTNRIVIILLEIGSQCCWKSKTKPHWIWTEEHCLWLIVWTEPVSIDKHRCSDLVGWVSSLWEFQTWGLCWEITPVLIIWPWVSWCWTRREDWTLRSTSWRYC